MKIYINDKPLYIISEPTKELDRIDLKLIGLNATNLTIALEHLQFHATESVTILVQNNEDILNSISKFFEIITAGGGVVQNNFGEILLIFRNGKWDLPKGKLDPGETVEECAIREVTEETGLKDISIEEKLTITNHVYYLDNRNILKQSHWFKMHAGNTENMQAQTEEGIEELKWVKKESLTNYCGNTYPSIIDVFQLIKNG